MKLYLDRHTYIETDEPIDLSIAITDDQKGPRAWYLEHPQMLPVMDNGFIGSVALGGVVNFRNINFNPHGHGTHTESHGHITEAILPVSKCFTGYFFHAALITLTPELKNGDWIITKESMQMALPKGDYQALVIRTLPNEASKQSACYSNTNPAYLSTDILELLTKQGILHLLIDLPSVDKEQDGGALAFHHAFWNVPDKPQTNKTITELIYVPNDASDGLYLLELQLSNFTNDAAPSRPLLYKKRKEA